MANVSSWDAEDWLKRFNGDNVNYRQLRIEVWEDTKRIVEAGGYTLPNGKSISIPADKSTRGKSSFYSEEMTASFEPLKTEPQITVVPDDCLDTAHAWINEGLSVSVLNLASRKNPGGWVRKGSGAQEEYLFRCSDYYKFMYQFASYAWEYGLQQSDYQYPLDRNFGGIYSPGVTVFRENEETGYRLADYAWQVNMIAVAGINHPETVIEDGRERIAPFLVDGVKNKIRTIFRIACLHGQRNLVLGALGCGAFRNPPEHAAELFREVLGETEFSGAFRRVCFAIKSDHNSKGSRNYLAFKKVFSPMD